MNVLDLVPAVRAGGKNKAERSFLDFKIDRRRLSSLLDVRDRPSVLGWLARKDERRYVRQLLGREPSDFATGRVPLYICPECADLGCGAVTVRVIIEGDTVTWSELSLESPMDSSPIKCPWPVPESFSFELAQYRNVLSRFG